MTISANDRPADERRLQTSIDLYRDLSEALKARISALKRQRDFDPDCRETVKALDGHHRALQTVLDIEGRLGKRSRAWREGDELDLAGARAEILARLARWEADGGA